MKYFDMHIHLWKEEANAQALLQSMAEAGVCGGCVLSRPPMEYDTELGRNFDVRLEEVLNFCGVAPDRLFPILWVHPDEEDVIEHIRIGAQKGVLGYKIICNNFYIYEERCLEMLHLMAQLNKPVIFHTGILWDGKTSSQYNQPLNFEALLRIEGLRFSMGHCSWPWVDDCIALYGKFMNAANYNDNNAEMFFDLTPGTPEIYREDLLKKLFTLGYDVENNVMFGTDNIADSYSVDWATQWLNIDQKIMDRYGVCKRVREKVYAGNLMRFLGLTNESVTHNAPTSDNANAWSCENPEVKTVIRKWAEKLGLMKDYRWGIEKALANIPVSDTVEMESYNISEPDGKRNLLSVLYMCEALSKRFAEKGIDEQILLDTLSDISVWLDIWSELKDEMYLGELIWLQRHLKMELFRLGRLQFGFGTCEHDIPTHNIKKGDPVLEVHIPADGAMTREQCDASFAMAKEFFAKFYPEYDYRCFTCHSWLLDPQLKSLLDEDSNIIRFQDRFEIVANDPSDAILRYVFRWNTTAKNLKYAPVVSSFAERVKKAYLTGTQFHESFGIIK
ncbi:MAG: hypothetical protein E7447_06885 [Ruminococcaceae bacterium]|nr:hypothetical protein [Oscillospiraceae bacterium]